MIQEQYSMMEGITTMEAQFKEENAAVLEVIPCDTRKKGYRFVKRMTDILCSLFALIVLSPVFLITMIAIRLEDGGPAFFSQKRIGQHEREYKMFKFRSMRMDAEQIHEKMREQYGEDEVSFKLKDDPRITKVGRFIRNTNIDELPQLINILRGDMSIVGNCYIIGTTKKNPVFSSVCPIG